MNRTPAGAVIGAVLALSAALALTGGAQTVTLPLATDSTRFAVVGDTGPGLSPEVEARLFRPVVSTKIAGMGVGLSISRSIIEAHGGRLWATRNEAGGMTFHFTLPAAALDD